MKSICIVLLALIALSVPVAADAAGCAQFFYRPAYRQHYVAPVVAHYAAPIYYGVGQDIQQDAIAERIALKVQAKLEALQQAQQASLPQKADYSILTAKCATCHSGANPKGALLLDGSGEVPGDSLRAWMKMAAFGEDVPAAMKPVIAALKPEDVAAITEALLKSGQ